LEDPKRRNSKGIKRVECEAWREERRGERGGGGGMGDQAYAPFGAGRETGHQVPVVAAKIESVRYRELRNTLCHEEKRRKMGRGLSNGMGFSLRGW
jgi:hypothetical protein